MIHPTISNIAQICARMGIKKAIISPGSRNAALSISFSRHPEIECLVANDERSAAFIALGISQVNKIPTVLICTSGSAAYNYSPAVAEAYFQQIPLLILTADRPPEWIDQLDGQTIRQFDIYGNHIKKSYQAPVSFEHQDARWHMDRITSEAINIASSSPAGPVHINIPFREPFYPDGQEVSFEQESRVIKSSTPVSRNEDWKTDDLLEEWKESNRILIIAGQSPRNPEMDKVLEEICQDSSVTLVADIISNQHGVEAARRHQDLFLQSKPGNLQADLLISFGKSVISKNLKLHLRANPPKHHWHIQESPETPDTFQSISRWITARPEDFFNSLKSFPQKNTDSCKAWKELDQKAGNYLNDFLENQDFNEFSAVKKILDGLNGNTNLHLANSMSVRYANYIGIREQGIEVFANRGTSGIDGSTSTALGAALESPERTNVLITGDMAFFYDRNAFWNNFVPENLKIVLLNNHAGIIFGNIKGPSDLPENELEKLFESHQPLNAESLASEFGINYHKCTNAANFDEELKQFLSEEGSSIFEIETDKSLNKYIFRTFKEGFKA